MGGTLRHMRLFLFIVGVMKVLGLFPYRFDRHYSAATLCWPLLVYSLMLAMSLWGLAVYVQITFVPSILLTHTGTKLVVLCFQNFSYLIYSLIIPIYFIVGGRKLAKTLASLLEFHDKQIHQFPQGQLDKQAIYHLLIVLAFIVAAFPRHIDYNTPLFVLIVLNTFYILPSLFILGVFYSALFKLLSFMLAAVFIPLENLFCNVRPKAMKGQGDMKTVAWDEDKATSVPSHKASHTDPTLFPEKRTELFIKVSNKNILLPQETVWKTSTPSIHQQEADTLLFVRRCLIFIEEMEVTVSGFLAPLLCVQLLLECVWNISLLIFIVTGDQPTNFTGVTTAVACMLRLYLMLEAPESYHRKVREAIYFIGTVKNFIGLNIAH